MIDVIPLPFNLPFGQRKKIIVDFYGGNQLSGTRLLVLPKRSAIRAASVTMYSRWRWDASRLIGCGHANLAP